MRRGGKRGKGGNFRSTCGKKHHFGKKDGVKISYFGAKYTLEYRAL